MTKLLIAFAAFLAIWYLADQMDLSIIQAIGLFFVTVIGGFFAWVLALVLFVFLFILGLAWIVNR